MVTAPIVTASPKTPLVIVKKDEDGKPAVSINPAPQVSTPEAPAPAPAPAQAVPAAPTADNSISSGPTITASGKKADEPAIVTPAPAPKDLEVTAAKTVTATPDADIKKIVAVVAKVKASAANVDEKGAAED